MSGLPFLYDTWIGSFTINDLWRWQEQNNENHCQANKFHIQQCMRDFIYVHIFALLPPPRTQKANGGGKICEKWKIMIGEREIWSEENLILWSLLSVHIMAIKYWKKLLLFGFRSRACLSPPHVHVRLSEFVVVANKQFISRCWNLMALAGIAMANVPRIHIVRKYNISPLSYNVVIDDIIVHMYEMWDRRCAGGWKLGSKILWKTSKIEFYSKLI